MFELRDSQLQELRKPLYRHYSAKLRMSLQVRQLRSGLFLCYLVLLRVFSCTCPVSTLLFFQQFKPVTN